MSLKKLTDFTLHFLLTFILLVYSFLLTAQAPTHLGKFDFIDKNINGFWEYLPRNYSHEPEKTYPLLIFIHGAGESGKQPNMETLNRVRVAGVPALIHKGKFPETFSAEGQTFSFIVISPQIINGIEIANNVGTSTVKPSTIEAIITYAKTHYRIDESRIYLCGLSMGGGAVWDYAGSSVEAAKKIAAIVVAAGAGDLSQEEANNIAAANLPVIATHNIEDLIVQPSRTQANIARINHHTPKIQPAPKAFYFTTGLPGNHNSWTRTFEELQPVPGKNVAGILGRNIYEWMLSNQRTTAALPVTWLGFTTAIKGQHVALEWLVGGEKDLKSYDIERSTDGRSWQLLASIKPKTGNDAEKKYVYSDMRPSTGLNYYRVKQTDLDGRFTYSVVRHISFTAVTASVRIFPNPVHNKLFISSPEHNQQKLTIEIFAPSGALIGKEIKQPGNNEMEINMNAGYLRVRGLLLVRISDESGAIILQQQILKN